MEISTKMNSCEGACAPGAAGICVPTDDCRSGICDECAEEQFATDEVELGGEA